MKRGHNIVVVLLFGALGVLVALPLAAWFNRQGPSGAQRAVAESDGSDAWQLKRACDLAERAELKRVAVVGADAEFIKGIIKGVGSKTSDLTATEEIALTAAELGFKQPEDVKVAHDVVMSRFDWALSARIEPSQRSLEVVRCLSVARNLRFAEYAQMLGRSEAIEEPETRKAVVAVVGRHGRP